VWPSVGSTSTRQCFLSGTINQQKVSFYVLFFHTCTWCRTHVSNNLPTANHIFTCSFVKTTALPFSIRFSYSQFSFQASSFSWLSTILIYLHGSWTYLTTHFTFRVCLHCTSFLAGCIQEGNTSVTFTFFSSRSSPWEIFFKILRYQWFIVINVSHIKPIWLCVATVSENAAREYVIVLDFMLIALIYLFSFVSCCIPELHGAPHDSLAFLNHHSHWLFLIWMHPSWLLFPGMCLANFIQAITLSPFTIHLCYCAPILNSQSHRSCTSNRW
jgi:hypothetical protein